MTTNDNVQQLRDRLAAVDAEIARLNGRLTWALTRRLTIARVLSEAVGGVSTASPPPAEEGRASEDESVETTPADGNVFADLGLPDADERLALAERIREMHGGRALPDGYRWCLKPRCPMQAFGLHMHSQDASPPPATAEPTEAREAATPEVQGGATPRTHGLDTETPSRPSEASGRHDIAGSAT